MRNGRPIKENERRKPCAKCQNTGWCHANGKRCALTGKMMRIVRMARGGQQRRGTRGALVKNIVHVR